MKTLLTITFGVMVVMGEPSELLDEFALQNEHFSTLVYKEMLKLNSTNFLVCPLSVRIILALTYIGSGGSTAKELAAGLKIPNDKAKVNKIAHELTPYLRVDGNYTLTSANKIYLADRYRLSDYFKSTAVDVFDSDIQNIDFTSNTEAAAEMNKWVEERTFNKIRGLIQPYALDANTVAVLINAVYFKGEWLNKFDSEFTQKRKFFASNKREVEVDMMLTDYYFNYHYCPELKAQFLQLPYEGGDVVMTVILPDLNDGLSALEARIDEVFANRKYDLTQINVSLPKFKIETTIDFKNILMELGITEAFKENVADFREMSADGQNIFITDVVQKTFIDVTEKGTTAGAASAVIIGDRIFSGAFVADHPFLFFLKHRAAGIFFVGRFTTPEIAVPEVANQEVTVPEVTLPKTTTPSVLTPEVSIQNNTAPDGTTSEIAVPDKYFQAVAAPEAPVLVNNSPEITLFINNNPEISAPKITILVNNTSEMNDPEDDFQQVLENDAFTNDDSENYSVNGTASNIA